MRENNVELENRQYDVPDEYKGTHLLPQKLQEHVSMRMLFLVTSVIVLLPQEAQTPCSTVCHTTSLDVQKISELILECMLFFCIALLQKDPLKVKNVVQNGMLYMGLKNVLSPLLQNPQDLTSVLTLFYKGMVQDCITGEMIFAGFLLASPTVKQLFLQNLSISKFFKEASSEQVVQIHKQLAVETEHVTDTQTSPQAHETLAILKKIRIEGKYQTLMQIAAKMPHIKTFVDKEMLGAYPMEYILLILLFAGRDFQLKNLQFILQDLETTHAIGFFDPWKALLMYHMETFDISPLIMLMLYYTSVRAGMSLNIYERESYVRNKYEDWYFFSAYCIYKVRTAIQGIMKNLRQKTFLQ